jgi:anti-sigma factor RsiW
MNCPLESGGNAGHLLDYAAGKLKAEARAQMERHIAGCPACRAFAGGQQAVWRALDAWEPAAVSMDFDRRLYARIDQQASWWTRLTRPLDPLFRHALPIGAAAGVVLVAGLLMNRPAAIAVAPVEESAQVETLQPEQVEHALDDIEMLRELNQMVPDHAAPKM